MQVTFFRTAQCPDCARPAQELSACPWCGTSIAASLPTFLRLLMLPAGAIFLLFPSTSSSSTVLFAVATSATLIVAAAASPANTRVVAGTAVAVSALCHVWPLAAETLGNTLRFYGTWLIPAVALVASGGQASTLPPVPASTRGGRLLQALKTPAILLTLAAVTAVALHREASPASLVAVSCGYAALLSALQPKAATCLVLSALFEMIAVVPVFQAEGGSTAPLAFAVAVAVCGVIQTGIGMKRSESVPSSQP